MVQNNFYKVNIMFVVNNITRLFNRGYYFLVDP